MTYTTVEAIYAIRHKESGKFVKTSECGCWMSATSAKRSWENSPLAGKTYIVDHMEWEKYELVNLLDRIEDLQLRLDIAEKLLQLPDLLIDQHVSPLQMRISEMEAQLAFYKQR